MKELVGKGGGNSRIPQVQGLPGAGAGSTAARVRGERGVAIAAPIKAKMAREKRILKIEFNFLSSHLKYRAV